MYDPLLVLKKLPQKNHWRTSEVAEAFGLITPSIKRCSLKYGIGRIVGTRGTGTRIFVPDDIFTLCYYLRGPGNTGKSKLADAAAHRQFVDRQKAIWSKRQK